MGVDRRRPGGGVVERQLTREVCDNLRLASHT